MKQILLVLCAVVPIGCQQPNPKVQAWQGALEEAFNTSVDEGFSGAIYVAQGDTVLLDEAYGAIAGYAMETGTRFWISSTGKQFVAAAIIKAYEKGLIDLDDQIAKFFPDAPADKQTITVRQLLSHTSGFGQSYASEAATNYQEARDIILAENLVDIPGAAFHYSNNNFQLSVAILEKITGHPYEVFLQDEVFGSLGLSNTGQTGPEAGYLVAPTRQGTPKRLFTKQWGGQGMYSTTHDLAAWYKALVRGRVLEKKNVALLFQPVGKIKEGHSGLGWFVREAPNGARCVFVRGNDDFGANSLIYGYPDDDVVIVILTHGGSNKEGLSYSRALVARLESVLFPEND